MSGSKETELRQPDVVGDWHQRLVEDGARLVATAGRRAVARFGDAAEEHGHLTGGAGLIDDTDRAIVRIHGRRARQMIDGLVTNDLAPLDRGRAVYAFLLTARGRPIAETRVLPRGGQNELWLDVPPACLEGLLEHLGRTLPPLYARFELVPDVARVGIVGPRATEAVAAWVGGSAEDPTTLPPLGILFPAQDESPEPWTHLVRREPEEGPGVDLYLPVERLPDAWRELARAVANAGGGPAGRVAYDIWRIERGVPVYGAEIGLDVLPQETGQTERAISFSKGCFTGQEVVARIHYRGHVNRHLRGLRIEETGDRGAEPATDGGERAAPMGVAEAFRPGAELDREGRTVGTVTSVARSPRLGPIALAYVRREIEPGEGVAIAPDGPPELRVVELPFTTT